MYTKKTIMVIAAIFSIIIIIGLIALSTTGQSNVNNNGLYVDPDSGETVVTDSPLTQSSLDNPNAGTPTYLGFSFLYDRGLSIEQVEFTKNALFEYSEQHSNSFREVSLIKDSARYGSEMGDEIKELQFNIRVNREDLYYVTLTYSDLDSVTVKLYEDNKETLLFTKE